MDPAPADRTEPARRHRLTVRSLDPDPRAAGIAAAAAHLGLTLPRPDAVAIADIVFVEGELTATDLGSLHGLLADPLLQTATWDVPARPGVEVTFLPGVTDTAAASVIHGAAQLGVRITGAATGRRVELGAGVDDVLVDEIVRRVVANPVIERWSTGTVEPVFHPDSVRVGKAEVVALSGRTLDQLMVIGHERKLALDPEELLVVQAHFADAGREPTDVELETLAQTWSEHCAHKTFRARISADDGVERPSLLAMLRACTEELASPFVKSAFVGNAGIVHFRDDADGRPVTIALKAETHNHPSAVEPFGGANTGVGGVIRDVLGIAHAPIAVTDILCFGPPDTPVDDVPTGALHPLRIREGVIDGVADYGNKIGLPTVAGAILYDPAYTTNPLVFAGCIGQATGWQQHAGPYPGDRVVVLGGRTGRDGIRGATFSSLTMDATTGEVAGASVQIGDPVVEKLLIDVLVGAEHLFTAITDCGAGGLSSAIGEMAEGVGADVELDRVPLKYAGLEPWEIWLSEAQERMVIAVPPALIDELQARCDLYGVELADVGRFTGDGRLVVRSSGEPVVDLDTHFLHDGRPQRRLDATMPTPRRGDDAATGRTVGDAGATLLALLAHRNIASKAGTIHRYDHEILGATLVRPIVGRERDAPGDGVVLAAPTDTEGIAVGIGVNPWYGLHDPDAMAQVAVDEAIRNVVAVGADPDRVALLDNFSWGDPKRPSTLGELVAAVEGCVAAANAFRAPFVSGKDSLNNEYTGSDGQRHAVPPTLVITAVAHVPDADRCVQPVLHAAGNVLVLVGRTAPEFAGSHLDMVAGEPAEPGVAPQPDPDAPERYRRLHRAILDGLVRSCHDVSEGGLAVALAELCIAGRLGAEVTALPHADLATSLFAESAGRLVVEVAPGDVDTFGAAMGGDSFVLGTVTDTPALALPGVAPIDVGSLVAAFNREGLDG
ncbi:MAG: phosphoribosylformylglycinamidine synthase subunit PurL [Acidimicrobiales bacterium]|nr:phosphoribosylformylglycinamidine synthase subunit PurL [Acidimicrobiales bacterium]